MVSIIIPCYNSEQSLKTVVNNMAEALRAHKIEYQFILVCDGSPDNTFSVIKELCSLDPNIIGINLSRNFGQQAARMAALPYIRGEYVVFMDDDGQHPTQGIFPLLEKLDEGYDIAYARFKHRQYGLLRKLGTGVNKFMANKIIGMPPGTSSSSYFAVKYYIARELINYTSPNAYIHGYFVQATRNIAMVDMPHQDRISGKSGFTPGRLLSLWINGFTSFSIKPLRVSSVIGAIVSAIGFVYGIYIAVRKLINPNIAVGYTSLMAALLFTGGMILLMLGLLGEYVGRIFMAINRLPQYVIKDVIGDDSGNSLE